MNAVSIPIKLEVTTKVNISGGTDFVQAKVTGKVQKRCTDVYKGLKLTRRKIEQALEKIYKSCDFNGFHIPGSGYNTTFTSTETVEILSQEYYPIVIDKEMISNISCFRRTFTAALTQTVKNTVAVKWSSKDQFPDLQIHCDVRFNGSSLITFKSVCGVDSVVTKEVTIGPKGVSVELPREKNVMACLQVIRRVLTLKVTYSGSVSGSVIGYYGSVHSKSFKLRDVLNAAGMAHQRIVSAIVHIQSFTDAEIKMSNIW